MRLVLFSPDAVAGSALTVPASRWIVAEVSLHKLKKGFSAEKQRIAAEKMEQERAAAEAAERAERKLRPRPRPRPRLRPKPKPRPKPRHRHRHRLRLRLRLKRRLRTLPSSVWRHSPAQVANMGALAVCIAWHSMRQTRFGDKLCK